MNYITLDFSSGRIKSLMLVSLLVISSFAFAVPIAAKIPIQTECMKISHSLLNMIETHGDKLVDILIATVSNNYDSVIADIQGLGGYVRIKFQYVNALAASVPASKILALAENMDVIKIYYDEPRSLAGAIPLVPEPEVKPETASAYLSGYETINVTPEVIAKLQLCNYWNPVVMGAAPVWKIGDYGQDTLVVIIDTGLWAGHFLFAGTSIIGGVDLSPDVGTEYEGWNRTDNHWHGTHVAGIIAGTGGIIVPENDLLVQSIELYTGQELPSAEPYGYPGYKIVWLLGMAPYADLFAIKVFPHTGEGVPESYILAGLEYALNMKLEQGYDVDVISMSLGGPSLFDGRDIEDQLVDYITSHGITVVAAAGNEGPAPMTVASPGSANTAITVGAAAIPVQTRVFWDYYYGELGIGYYLFTSEKPQIIYFSSRGPTSDGRLKPTLAAAGVFILSAWHNETYPQDLAWASGTSMATPAVSGAVALLNTYAEKFIPGATPEDYKQALQKGAVWLEGYSKYDQGAGFLNAWNALQALINDPSIGDVAKPLPPYGWLEDISNIPIFSAGTYETDIVDLPPGHKKDFIFEVTHFTGSIELEITDLKKGVDLGLNSLEVYIQSAKRTTYAYFIDSANVWGNARFLITDYETTWSGKVTGVYMDSQTRLAPIEPGYVKIVIENDWTSFDNISCHIKIKVRHEKPQTGHCSYVVLNGKIAEGESTGWIKINVPKKAISAEITLYWLRDWSTYPTSDLDLYVYWDQGPSYDGATLNSPERVIIGRTKTLYVRVDGYKVYAPTEQYLLIVKFTMQQKS
ncbi:MAG: S8 family serine peptidase [Candidatus Bathyarchaeia archaeon]